MPFGLAHGWDCRARLFFALDSSRLYSTPPRLHTHSPPPSEFPPAVRERCNCLLTIVSFTPTFFFFFPHHETVSVARALPPRPSEGHETEKDRCSVTLCVCHGTGHQRKGKKKASSLSSLPACSALGLFFFRSPGLPSGTDLEQKKKSRSPSLAIDRFRRREYTPTPTRLGAPSRPP